RLARGRLGRAEPDHRLRRFAHDRHKRVMAVIPEELRKPLFRLAGKHSARPVEIVADEAKQFRPHPALALVVCGWARLRAEAAPADARPLTFLTASRLFDVSRLGGRRRLDRPRRCHPPERSHITKAEPSLHAAVKTTRLWRHLDCEQFALKLAIGEPAAERLVGID